MLNVLTGKSREVVSGKVERVGATGYKGDVFYMTLLLEGGNRIYTVFFESNDTRNNSASLTQPGDVVEFEISEFGLVKIRNFRNETIENRLKQPELKTVRTF